MAFLVIGLLVGIGAAWAASTLLFPQNDVLQTEEFTTISAVEGEVGSTLAVNARVQWTTVPVGANMSSGIVTGVSVEGPTDLVQGSVLYSVNLRPVLIAQGTVPAFRAIELGVKGQDVTQLQSMLHDLGYYDGILDGDVGSRTVAAIKKWQKELGLEQTGRVEVGDVIYVPVLPSKVTIDVDVIARGKPLSGGEMVVEQLPAEPGFVLPLAEGQAALIPSGAEVELRSPAGTVWHSRAGSQEKDDTNGTVIVPLNALDGSTICGAECSAVPLLGETLVPATVITLAPVSGITVPSAAILTHADGKTFVVDAGGKSMPVTVTTSARGMSVIAGIEAGTLVRVPASE